MEELVVKSRNLYESQVPKFRESFLSNYKEIRENEKCIMHEMENIEGYHKLLEKKNAEIKNKEEILLDKYEKLKEMSKSIEIMKLELESLEKLKKIKENVRFLRNNMQQMDFQTIDNLYKTVFNERESIGKESFESVKYELSELFSQRIDKCPLINDNIVLLPDVASLKALSSVLNCFSIENRFFNSLFIKTKDLFISINDVHVKFGQETTIMIMKTNPTVLLESFIMFTNIFKDSFTENEPYVQDFLKIFAESVVEYASQLPGGKLNETEDQLDKLCSLVGLEKMCFVDVSKKNRLPKALEECRNMLNEGMPFGSVVERMNAIFKGSSSDGALSKISIMALAIWKEDLSKLQAAISVFSAIGTSEALECLVLFENYLKLK